MNIDKLKKIIIQSIPEKESEALDLLDAINEQNDIVYTAYSELFDLMSKEIDKITLADVLIASKNIMSKKNDNSVFTDDLENIVMNWNLEDNNLNNQLDGTKKLLINLLIPKEETPVQQVVNHYLFSLDLDIDEIKEQCKSGEINYARHTRDAKQILELTDGNIEEAKEAIDKIADWASGRGLSYTLSLVVKRWLELNQLD